MAGEPRSSRGPLRRLLTIVAAGLVLAGLAIVAAVGLAIDSGPALPAATPWTLTELSRLKAVVGEELRHGQSPERVLTLTRRDLEILAGQALRGYGAPRFAVELSTGRARVRSSAALPWGSARAWLNLDAQLNDSPGMPEVESLRIGSLPVPAWLAESLIRTTVQRLVGDREAAGEILKRVSFASGQLKLTVDWRDDSARVVAGSLVGPAELERWHAYADALSSLTRARSGPPAASMVDLIAPMFALAHQRSRNSDAAAENRAALLVLTLYVNGRSLAAITPQARRWQEPRMLRVTLNGRTDTPLHFLISAAIAAEAGGPMADAVGLYKEASDAQGGSGFSFNDLAADRAGARFGLLAARSPQQLQRLLAGSLSERDLMPEVADLPEGLAAPAFADRFGRVGTPAYERLVADIDARIDRCRVTGTLRPDS